MKSITSKYVQVLVIKIKIKYKTYVSISINVNAYNNYTTLIEYTLYIARDNVIKSDTSNNLLYFKTIDELINKMEELINE